MKNRIGCNIVAPEVTSENDYTKDLYIKRVWDYAAYGIKYVEFSHLLALTVEDAAEIRNACRNAGVIPWSVHSEHLNEDVPVEKYFQTQTHCARIADALDARVMVCHLPNLNPRFDFDRAVKVIEGLADITAAHNVRLAVENCLEGDSEFIIRLIDTVQRTNVGFNLDTGHAFRYQEGYLPELIRKIGKRLITTHIHDNFGLNDDHQMPGMGRIDWNGVLAALQETGYQGALMMEMTGPFVKSRRTVEMLRDYDLEKEVIQGSAYLNYLWNRLLMK